MSDNIDGAINKIETIIKHGKPILKKRKLKAEVLNKIIDPEIKDMIQGADNVLKVKRKVINKENRKNAHNIVADTRAKISKEVGNDLGLDMN